MRRKLRTQAIERGKYDANDLRVYERRWKAVFGRELRIGYYARMLYETLSDVQIERLMDEFLSDGSLADYIGEDVAFDWHGKVILKGAAACEYPAGAGYAGAVRGAVRGEAAAREGLSREFSRGAGA